MNYFIKNIGQKLDFIILQQFRSKIKFLLYDELFTSSIKAILFTFNF